MICPSCQRRNRPTAHFCANCRAPLLLQNKYRVTRLLGRGGFGAVYQAEQLHLGNAACAVKELLPDPNATPQQEQQAAAQFQFEANVLARLSDPALPKVTDSFKEGGRYYLVMEYVEGETLEEVLARTGQPLPEAHVLAWASALCDVLTYLHTHQPNPVIHRDIKPSNIKITPDSKVKLVDFGIAKALASGVGTATAARAVSPPYSPMEQYGTGTDARSDIYALGVTLYQLVTNRLPPEAPNRALEAVISPCQWNPGLSPSVNTAIIKAIALNPTDRFQGAEEMQRALRVKTAMRATLPASVNLSIANAPRSSSPSKYFTTGIIAGVGFGVLLLLVLALCYFAVIPVFVAFEPTATHTATIATTGTRGLTVTWTPTAVPATLTLVSTLTRTRTSTALATPTSASTPTPISRFVTWTVNATSEWSNTGVYVSRGQSIQISSTGRWSHGQDGGGQPYYGPDGYEKIDPNTLLPNAKVGSLIGRIGNSQPFLVGSNKSLTADNEGYLLLSMNDVLGSFSNNDGFVKATITIR